MCTLAKHELDPSVPLFIDCITNISKFICSSEKCNDTNSLRLWTGFNETSSSWDIVGSQQMLDSSNCYVPVTRLPWKVGHNLAYVLEKKSDTSCSSILEFFLNTYNKHTFTNDNMSTFSFFILFLFFIPLGFFPFLSIY